LILNETLPPSEIRRREERYPVAGNWGQHSDVAFALFARLLQRNESPVTLMNEALATFAFPFVDIMSIRAWHRLRS